MGLDRWNGNLEQFRSGETDREEGGNVGLNEERGGRLNEEHDGGRKRIGCLIVKEMDEGRNKRRTKLILSILPLWYHVDFEEETLFDSVQVQSYKYSSRLRKTANKLSN